MHAITVRADEGGMGGGPKVHMLPTWESFIDFNYKLIAEAKLNKAEGEVRTRENAIIHSPERIAARHHRPSAEEETGQQDAAPLDRVDMGTWWGVPQTKAPWENQKSIIQTGGGYSPTKVIKEENRERERSPGGRRKAWGCSHQEAEASQQEKAARSRGEVTFYLTIPIFAGLGCWWRLVLQMGVWMKNQKLNAS